DLGSSRRATLIRKLELATGATVWSRWVEQTTSAPVLDEQGNVYVGHGELVSLSPSGLERWRAPVVDPPLAAFNGDLLLTNGQVRATADGAQRALPFRNLFSNALMLPAGRIVMTEDWAVLRIEAHAFGPGAATGTWDALVKEMHGGNWVTWSTATSSGGFLVGSGDTRHPNWLKAFDATGAERWACQLDANEGTSMLEAPVALLDGRWAMRANDRLSVFSVPGERPAPRGWVSGNGNGQGSRRPLP
ncbi:MAG: hypothetical protein JNK82_27295, partial [Myxococcaceae bacterium]|nr:hypothetical protein [Myxococcaceae bacterium]